MKAIENVTETFESVTKTGGRVTKLLPARRFASTALRDFIARSGALATFRQIASSSRSAASMTRLRNSPPMSAAERQRKCRAGGKGRHRGGVTKRMREEARQRVLEAWAATQATPALQSPMQPGASAMAA